MHSLSNGLVGDISDLSKSYNFMIKISCHVSENHQVLCFKLIWIRILSLVKMTEFPGCRNL